MSELRDIDLGAGEIRARHSGWEIPAAIVVAIATVIVLMNLGVRIELWESGVTWFERIQARFSEMTKSGGGNASENTAIFDPGKNPFLQSPNNSPIRYHPFITQTVPQNAMPRFDKDFFGFRNRDNLYFNPCECRLVVVTGNSEVAGADLEVPWSEYLERELNERSEETWRVMNLGMSGVTSTYEMNYYVNLAYDLKPDFVISHAFVGDIHHGLAIPFAFKKAGLNYVIEEVHWARRIHGQDISANAFSFDMSKQLEGLVEAFVKSEQRYKSLVEGNGGRFILGIPRFELSKLEGRPGSALHWPVTAKLHKEFLKDLQDGTYAFEYIDFNNPEYEIETSEGVHTAAESAPKVAKVYAERILKLWAGR